MLVLTRKPHQQVGIGDMTVTVLAITPGQVRLGFDGPRSTAVTRPDAKSKEPKPMCIDTEHHGDPHAGGQPDAELVAELIRDQRQSLFDRLRGRLSNISLDAGLDADLTRRQAASATALVDEIEEMLR